MNRRIYTDEAAKILRRKPRTLYRWRREGIGPKSYKDGMFVFYLEDELNEYLESQTQ